MTSPFRERMAAGDTLLGIALNDPDMIELVAKMGFDWVLIDQMFTGNDWSHTEMLLRTARSVGLAGMVRVHSNPWVGVTDVRIAAEVSRAIGIGAEYVQVSAATMAELEACGPLSRDWHQRPMHLHPFDNADDWKRKRLLSSMPLVAPQLESADLLRNIEAVIDLPDVHYVQFAMTDASRVLKDCAEPDWDLPELWDIVERAVRAGRQKGVVIGANISYAYDLAEVARRVRRLQDTGVQVIMLQTVGFLFQVALAPLLADIQTR